MTRVIAISASLAASLAICSPAQAETVSFKADMTGASEIPASTSSATGSVTVAYDTASKVLTWKGSYTGLSAAPTAAHFHGPTEPGKNAGAAVAITDVANPFNGTAKLTDAHAADLTAGRWYVNIHTAAHPDGEIRGQIMKVE